MKLLLDNKFAPISSEIGFLETNCQQALREFVRWQEPLYQHRGISLTQRAVSGPLGEVLSSLLPLTSVERRRYLFVPTTELWVAYFDNGYQGTDTASVISYLAQRMRCRGLRVVGIPNTIQSKGSSPTGYYGAVIFEVYGPEETDFLNYIRSISVVNEGGRWTFDQAGTPFPFEDTERYNRSRVKERFTFEMLRDYLLEFGIRAFDEQFYLPASDNMAALVEKNGPNAPGLKQYLQSEVSTGL
jgi:hypothetical protein